MIGVERAETQTIVERLFPVTVPYDLDEKRVVEAFGPRAVTSSAWTGGGWTYDIDDTMRWAYFKRPRFKTEADAALAVMFAATGVDS
jgi:hypothetical protein